MHMLRNILQGLALELILWYFSGQEYMACSCECGNEPFGS